MRIRERIFFYLLGYVQSSAASPLQALRFHLEHRCKFSYERLKLPRAARTPLSKVLRERLIGMCGEAEKSQGSPAARFFFKNRQKLGRNDYIAITAGGILAQGGLVRAEPNHERGSCRQMVLRQGQSFLRICGEPGSVVPPSRIRRRDQPRATQRAQS